MQDEILLGHPCGTGNMADELMRRGEPPEHREGFKKDVVVW